MRKRIRYLTSSRNKVGTRYYYHRRTRERLGTDPERAAQRAIEINAELERREAARRRSEPEPGTLDDLIQLFQDSQDFQRLSAKSQYNYRRHMTWLSERFGADPLHELDREAVIEIRDARAAAPREADYLVSVLSRLVTFALDRPRRFGLERNPCTRIRRLATGGEGWPPWPDELIASWREHAPAAERRAVLFLIGTGLRRGDAVRAAWPWRDEGGLRVPTSKTSAEAWCPPTPELREVMADTPRRATTILTNAQGQPWTPDHLSHRIADINAWLGHPGYSPHGLRKNAAIRLYEAGATLDQIGLLAGWAGRQIVERYIQRADQVRAGKAVVEQLRGRNH